MTGVVVTPLAPNHSRGSCSGCRAVAIVELQASSTLIRFCSACALGAAKYLWNGVEIWQARQIRAKTPPKPKRYP